MGSLLLRDSFTALLSNYTEDKSLLNACWIEIEEHYSAGARYHTLQHLDHLLVQLTAVKEKIINWDAILFTLYYHDIIYDVLKSDNEAQSAQLAEKRLKQFSVPLVTIELCNQQILATKAHLEAADRDTNYFTDADLSILGAEWELYALYYRNVRKEYSVYPDPVYNPGRKKVLNHFLSMDRVFKTDHFYDKFEARAKENLIKELHELG